MKTIGLFKAVFISALALTSISAHAEEKWTKITIATEGAFRPYNFTKPDGSLDGYEVDLYKDLCARMKVECTMVAQPSTASFRRSTLASSMPSWLALLQRRSAKKPSASRFPMV